MHIVIHLGAGAHCCQRADNVTACERGDAFGDRLAGISAARCCADDAARRDVVGDSHEGRVEVRAEDVLVRSRLLIVEVSNISGDRIDVIVVVTVLRHGEGLRSQVFIALPIRVHSGVELGQCSDFVFKDKFLDHGEGVGNYGEADPREYRTNVVVRTAVGEVCAPCQAIVDARGEERSRDHGCVKFLRDDRRNDGVISEIIHLCQNGLLDVVKCLLFGDRAGVEPHLFTGHSALAFVEGVFHGGGEVDVDR